MRHTAVQRRLLKEDSATTLDVPASPAGSSSQVWKTAPEGGALHAGPGVGPADMETRTKVRDAVSTMTAYQKAKEAMISLEEASTTLRTAHQGASGVEAQLFTRMSSLISQSLENIKKNLVEYAGPDPQLSHLVNTLIDSKHTSEDLEQVAKKAFS
jgi:hypothetical protein